jgi:SPP1 gp7 family putative phage head morphogenesis protein
MKNEFQQSYIALFQTETEFYKSSALTEKELVSIRQYIKALEKQKAPSKTIILHLQKFNPKLKELWKAERVYYTEIKRADSEIVADAGEELKIKSYRAILSRNACEHCVKALKGKIFKANQLAKNGNPLIPIHPNCYCVLIPEE